MRIAIVFATTEGQTAKVAQRAAATLEALGHAPSVIEAAAATPPDVEAADAAILAGSVHLSRFQSDLGDFARKASGPLAARPVLFLPVSLSAAGDDAGDWAGLEAAVTRFLSGAGLDHASVEHVAGAFRFTRYGRLKARLMRWVGARRGQKLDPGHDRELTDWDALDAALHDSSARLGT